jgi:uncharacterized protein YecE (DUF72 family)
MKKSNPSETVRVAVAGWSIPKEYNEHFPAAGSHLERYSARFPAVEINSSFYKSHRPVTYARWADSVPESFRFSVKVPKSVTHERRLVDVSAVLDSFLAEVSQLGDKLGPLLVQLPPSLPFDAEVAETFFTVLTNRFDGRVAVEPRHASWFKPAAERLLTKYCVARVAADPAVVPAAAEPGGWDGLVYYRWHGSPKVYYSSYADEQLEALAATLTRAARSAQVWCVFDNTAAFAATANALHILDQVSAN